MPGKQAGLQVYHQAQADLFLKVRVDQHVLLALLVRGQHLSPGLVLQTDAPGGSAVKVARG